MLGLSVDLDACVLVASMSGDHLSADHARVYAAIDDLDRSGHEKSRSIAMIFVVAPNTSGPDAHWRRKFAEQRKAFGSPRVFLSMVTQSALMRGILTAMTWIVPEPASMTSATHATFEEGAEWIERNQGTTKVALRALLDAARSGTRSSVDKLRL